MKKALSLSIIIPVYNEAHRLNACLDAVAMQIVKPDEVIVVDNNSTDGSVKIAKSYAFVKLVHEKEQGLIPARDHGFTIAKGDILGRIDADSMIRPDWVSVVKSSFDDPKIAGVSGPGYSLLLPRIRKPMTTLWSELYFLWTLMFYRVPVVWGANMAIRSTAWETAKSQICPDGRTVHEDQDLSLILQADGGTIGFNKSMLFSSNTQAYHYFPKLMQYIIMRHTTRNYHRKRGTFEKLKFTKSRSYSFVFYVIGWPIIFIFILASFLSWPIDLIMKALGKQKEWLS